jgi:hypothetical protein
VFAGVAYLLHDIYGFKHNDHKPILDTFAAIFSLLSGVLLIVSGVILVVTVFAIRSFYRKREEVDAVDTAALVRHAAAFAFFLVAALVFNLSQAIYDLFPSSPFVKTIFLYSVAFYAVTSFVSQLLLCTILWSLGTNLQSNQTCNESSRLHYSLNVAAFDSDAVL